MVALGAAATMALALVGCSGGDDASGPAAGASSPTASAEASGGQAGEAGQPFSRYVALGDSYTAAPLTPGTDLAGGCLRSTRNYPARLAGLLDVDVVDVSCSGASTDDVTQPQTFQVPTGETVRIPPQRRALDVSTDLVTIGLGGNDEGLFSRLAGACTQGDDTSCAAALDSEAVGRLDTTTANLEAVVAQVRDRVADDAVVVLVGYPRIAGEQTCDALPVDTSVLGRLDEAVRALNDAVAAAADASGATYLDVYAPSQGHDVCADDPWVNGVETVRGEALGLHPFAVEQQAVAELLEPVVRAGATS